MNELKQDFLNYIEIVKGRSLKTIENYDRYLSKFFSLAEIKNLSDITEKRIQDFRLKLNHSGKIAPKTQNYYLIAIRMFLKFLSDQKKIETVSPSAIELAKTGMREIDIISLDEFKRILNIIDTETLKGLRDRAMLELLYSTGLRISELLSLKRNIDLTQDEFSVRGKGEKIRVVFISEEAKKHIKNYLNERPIGGESLFVSVGVNNDESLTQRTVQRIVDKYARSAGIMKQVTPHTIRHLFATNLLENGADIRSVQEMLGHSNISTTQVYTHITNKRLLDVHKKFHS